MVPYLLQSLDYEGLKIFNSFNLSAEEMKVPANIYKKFEERLNISKPNFRTARLDLHFYDQEDGETIDTFYTRCKEKMGECTFNADEEKRTLHRATPSKYTH